MFALLICLSVPTAEAGAQTDSLRLDLDSTTFVGRRHSSAIQAGKAERIEVDMSLIQNMPRILGNTDPLSFIRLLPGVQTNSEYDSGINIQGCDNAHNDISISGVHVFGATHLFGLFSVFNPAHYKKMTFSRSPYGASSANRLGGSITMMLPDSTDRNLSGEVSVGLMSSQGTLRVRTGQDSWLHLSARRSYLNLLYGRWLKIDRNDVTYGFGDYNLTWFRAIGRKDRVWADFYFGRDNASISAGRYFVDLGAKWGNLTGALHWEHTGTHISMRHTLFSSGHSSLVRIEQDDASLHSPSSILTAGYKGTLTWKKLRTGADVTLYRAALQSPTVKGLFNTTDSRQEKQTGLEADIHADYTHAFSDSWSLLAGAKAGMYLSPEQETFFRLSPTASLAWNGYHLGHARLSYGWQHQYIFNTGLSNIGLPTEFWFLAGSHGRPQSAQSVSLSYGIDLLGGMLNVTADIYCKKLYNLVEYKGDLFDILTKEYDLDDALLKGNGCNYGASVMIHKQSGDFTGWVGYSIGRALRSFVDPQYPDTYPANHERIHEFNATGSYDLRKWNFSGSFVFASGRPFTAPEYYYLSAGQIMTIYGEHNACRMRPYIRLDLSVNRTFRKDGRGENGINFSVCNVLARKNEVMWRLHLNDDGEFAFYPIGFALRVLPSISYYHKF